MAQKRIYAVVYTPARHLIVKTKKQGTETMRAWKAGYERLGWKVTSLGPDAYAALAPDEETRHAVVFHEYDVETKQRVYKEFRPKAPVKERTEVAPRRGRSTPAWA